MEGDSTRSLACLQETPGEEGKLILREKALAKHSEACKVFYAVRNPRNRLVEVSKRRERTERE